MQKMTPIDETKTLWIFLIMLAAASCTNEQAIQPEEYLTSHREGVEKISEGVYRVGLVTVDANKGAVSFGARVNMEAGLIEYLICAEWGKLHESVLVTNANPLDIQLGLLALGMKYGGGLTHQGDPAQGKGDPVRIFVQWDDRGTTQEVRGERFVLNTTRETAMEEADWIFTGSVVLEEGFAAQTYGLIVATYNDPYAILNNPLPSRADDEILFVNSNAVPPVGTAVTVILEAANGPARSE
jgi:hypothetical protein